MAKPTKSWSGQGARPVKRIFAEQTGFPNLSSSASPVSRRALKFLA